MDYDTFRAEFRRKALKIEDTISFYPIIKLAESFPQYVKPTYRFLSDEKISEQEKIRILKVVHELAQNNPRTALDYILEPPTADKPIIKPPADVIKEFAAYITAVISDAEKLVQDAKDSNLKVDGEEQEISGYKTAVDISNMFQQAIESLEKTFGSSEVKGPVQ